MFALFSALSVGLSIRATSRSHHRATVVEVAGRQRTLAERYVREVHARAQRRAGRPRHDRDAAPRRAPTRLINGGVAPAVDGDDDETALPAADRAGRGASSMQEQRLVERPDRDGQRLAGRPAARSACRSRPTRRSPSSDPVRRLAVLAALTSNVSLNAARTIATSADRSISHLILTQVVLGVAGLLAVAAAGARR